jgi:hypothetical protein
MMTLLRNGLRKWRRGLLVCWISLLYSLIAQVDVCQAQFQINHHKPRIDHNGQIGGKEGPFGVDYIVSEGNKHSSKRAGEILQQPSALSTAKPSSSPIVQIPTNRIEKRRRNQRFRPRKTRLTPPPSNEQAYFPSSEPPSLISTLVPNVSPAKKCQLSGNSIGDATFGAQDIIIRYAYEIGISNIEKTEEILHSITRQIFDNVVALLAYCDILSLQWKFKASNKLELTGLSVSKVTVLDGTPVSLVIFE